GRLTSWARGRGWWVTSVEPSSRLASVFTSSIDLTTLTPPALPRPPAWIWAFTTTTGVPRSVAALAASSTENAGKPRGVGTPNSRSTALAWYSWMFIAAPAADLYLLPRLGAMVLQASTS